MKLERLRERVGAMTNALRKSADRLGKAQSAHRRADEKLRSARNRLHIAEAMERERMAWRNWDKSRERG